MSEIRLARGFAKGSLDKNPLLSQWIDLSTSGVVLLRVGKVEFGQGISTALAQIAAEQAAEQAEKDAAVAACTENCAAVIAAAEPPKKWYTFEMFRTTAKFFNLNQDEFMKNLDNNTKLEIYGLVKQGAKGDNTTEEPFFLDIKERHA